MKQGGSPHYEHMLSVLLNDVNEGAIRMERLVRVVCENPARIIGQYPHKGSLQPGTDADVVIVDMNWERELLDGDHLYTKQKWTPYHGWKVRGGPELVMLRGKVIAERGTVVGEPGYGQYIAGVPQQWTEPKDGISPGLALEPRGT
jgi:dihydroorotase-like cyclic amidohydrolase